MILGISISKEYDDYEILFNALEDIKFSEITCLEHELVKRYSREKHIPVQTFEIDWKHFPNDDPVTNGKFGPYNKKAPLYAAGKVVDYADNIIEIGNGDRNISSLGKDKIIAKAKKRWQF